MAANFEPVGCDERTLIDALNDHKRPSSPVNVGELCAISIVTKTRGELEQFIEKMDDEVGTAVIDSLCAASRVLKARLALVDDAFARLAAVAGVLEGGIDD